MAKIAGKTIATGIAGGTAGLAVLSKKAMAEYGEYEQLVGGVETLFKNTANKVKKYADEAYKTAGLSANDYMTTVTSFSASLLQSLGGDTEKAAEKAHTAVVDMSDNANKMGTDMASIQNAYQGFAKQNYTMLDNLKLGYGGTKTEMERLLKDAQKISGVKYDVSSYADIVDAIHVMQESMDIAGTTSKEASTTIQGSINSMKSAWTNFLTGMTDEEQDFDRLVNNLVDSVVTVAKNIIPKFKDLLPRLVQGITKVVQELSKQLPKIVDDLLPALVSGATELVGSFVTTLPSILSAITKALPKMLNGIETIFKNVLESFFGLKGINTSKLKNAIKALKQPASDIMKTVKNSVSTLIKPLVNNFLPSIIKAIEAVLRGIKPIIKAITPILEMIINSFARVIEALAPIFETIGGIIANMIKAVEPILEPVLNLITQIVEFLSPALDLILGIVSGIFAVVADIAGIVGQMVGELFGTSDSTISARMAEELDELASVSSNLTEISNDIETTLGNVSSSLSDTSGDLEKIDELKARMDELLDKTDLTPAEQQELTTIADLLGEKLPDFKATWEEMTEVDKNGNLTFKKEREEVRNAIDLTIAKLKEQYATEALKEQYKELYEKQIEVNKKVASAQDEITTKTESAKKAYEDYYTAAEQLKQIQEKVSDGHTVESGELEKAQTKYSEAEKVYNSYKDALTEAETALAETSGEQGKLNKQMEVIQGTMDVMTGKINDSNVSWNDYIQNIRYAFSQGFINEDELKSKFNLTRESLYNQTKSIGASVLEGYSDGVKNKKDEMVNYNKEWAGEVESAVRDRLKVNSPSKVFIPIGEAVPEGFNKGVSGASNSTVKTMNNFSKIILSTVNNAFTSIKSVSQKLVSNIVSSFSKLSDNVKPYLNSFLKTIQTFVNGIISGVNKALSAINSLNMANAEKSGKSSYTTYSPISSIVVPKLATGTVVPANYGEFLAVLGDNKREAEVVSPLSTIEQAVENVMSRLGGGGTEMINLVVNLDGSVIYRNTIQRAQQERRRTGKSPI